MDEMNNTPQTNEQPQAPVAEPAPAPAAEPAKKSFKEKVVNEVDDRVTKQDRTLLKNIPLAVLISVILYIVLGFIDQIGWLKAIPIWLALPTYISYALVRAATKEGRVKAMLMTFPVATCITMIFLCIGFWAGIWSPTWIMFLLIPVYTCLAAMGKISIP
jgi:hypothetical protein